MANDRKFFRTIFSVEVVSDKPLPEVVTLNDIPLQLSKVGARSITQTRRILNYEMGGFSTARVLIGMGSEPQHFDLDDEGRDIA